MKTNEKVYKPISETAYLTAENVKRYRSILRSFFIQYERVRYWMDQDEIYQYVRDEFDLSDYTLEQCKSDVAQLVEWKNLIAVQDAKHVNTIEDFKNKQYRYQLSEYGVEIERMTLRLEQLHIEGASLEPTLLERIERELSRTKEVVLLSNEEVNSWWNDLQSDFKRLNQNYQDYMRELSSARAEELMKSAEFLVYKDRLIDYLRSFVKSLQLHTGPIEGIFSTIENESVHNLIAKVVAYEMNIPRVDVEISEQEIRENTIGKWHSLRNWFVSDGVKMSEALRLFDMTNEIIRKITRYATQISEQFTMGANRKEEYRKLAEIFGKCENMNEAHKLSSMVFGVEKPMHLKADYIRETDSIGSGVYEEKPIFLTIKPRIRNYREKGQRSSIREHALEKEALRKATLEKIEQERKMVNELIENGDISFANLPVISEQVRNVLLRWLSKALENNEHTGKTEDGREYHVVFPKNREECILECEDGNFKMPAFVLRMEKPE